MRFYVKKIGIIQVVQNKEDFERSNAPINEGVIPEASYHFQKKKIEELNLKTSLIDITVLYVNTARDGK